MSSDLLKAIGIASVIGLLVTVGVMGLTRDNPNPPKSPGCRLEAFHRVICVVCEGSGVSCDWDTAREMR